MKRFLHKARSIVFLDGDDVRRAPMVAALLESFVSREPVLRLWDMKVNSAGSGKFTKEGASPDVPAVEAMYALGLDIASHRARSLSLETVREASIVFAMEQKHINYVTQHVCAGYPSYHNKIVLLLSYLGADFEVEKLVGTGSVTKYTDFAKQLKLLLPRLAYMIKHETLHPLLLKGEGVSTGVVEGKVKVVRSPSECREVSSGDVVVCQSNHVIQLYGRDCVEMASAIITDSMGEIHHLSELSHEMNIPCIGGTGSASELLQDGQVVILDGTTGLVYGKEGEW